MAALFEHVFVASFSSDKEFIAAESGNENDLLIVTKRSKGIDVFKEADQKLVKSWSVRHGLSLTSPVKWCSETDHFITVVNNQDIWFWDNETTDFEKAKKKHIKTAVHEVLVVPGLDPIVICCNGTVGFLEKIIDGLAASSSSNDVSGSTLTEDGSITWCKAATLLQNLCVLFVKQRMDDRSSLAIHIQWYNMENNTWTQQIIDLKPPESHHLHSVDCISHSEDIHVYSLWSNGDIQHMRINQHSVNPNKTIHTISGLGQYATMVMIDHSHAAVAGIKQADEEGLGIVDIKFGALQTWKPFPEACNRKVQLSCIGECLYLHCKRALYFHKFHCPPSSVSSLLGQHPDAAVRIISKETAVPSVAWESQRRIGQKPDEVQNLYMELLDAKKTDTYTKFKDAFGKLNSFLKKKNYSDWKTGSNMVKLIERCLSEKKFWAKDQLTELIRGNCIPSSLVPALFDALTLHGEVALISEALNSLHDVPEKALCTMMSFILQPENRPIIETEFDDAMETDSCIEGLTPQQVHLIKCVLRMPFSDVFLLECLRSLAFRDVLKLLQCLCKLIEENSFDLPEENERSSTPSNTNIVDWLCLLIDSHMTQLVISPDAHVLLLNLHSVVQAQVEFCEELAFLEALLAQLKEKSSLPQKQRVGQYCIEVLHVY